MIDIITVVILSYLIGSIPTAIIAGRLIKKIDIREHGSGNAGATNVLRVLGWKAAIVVFIIDMFKGFAPVWWLVDLISFADYGLEYRIYFQLIAGVLAIFGRFLPDLEAVKAF